MTTSVRDLLAAFEAPPANEQQQVAAEILRRTAATGELPEAAFDELAAELFRAYDTEELAMPNPDRGKVRVGREGR